MSATVVAWMPRLAKRRSAASSNSFRRSAGRRIHVLSRAPINDLWSVLSDRRSFCQLGAYLGGVTTADLKLDIGDHVVQFYETDTELVDTVSHYLADGINAGDAVIVVATDTHLRSL